MRRFLITIVVLLTAFVIYRFWGIKEASFRHNASQLRVKACLENPTIDLAMMFPNDEEILQQVTLGVDMAIAEANNRLNQDGSIGLQVEDSNQDRMSRMWKGHPFHNIISLSRIFKKNRIMCQNKY